MTMSFLIFALGLYVASLGFFAYAIHRLIRVSADRIVKAIDGAALAAARQTIGERLADELAAAQRMSADVQRPT